MSHECNQSFRLDQCVWDQKITLQELNIIICRFALQFELAACSQTSLTSKFLGLCFDSQSESSA